MIAPYPLAFEPLLFEKVWGGRRLERLAKALPPGRLIGESWEVADLGATSASGAGGAAARSRIANGPLAGRTLHDALALWGPALMGRCRPTPAGDFPLLVKFLDAAENLSVQVHPSPAYAAMHPGAHLKTECWYVLDAEPGAKIYKGVRPGVTRERFEAAIRDGSVPAMMGAYEARRGECHSLPSGVVHALGAGVLVAEVQTPSDTTFRAFDWGRAGRELHIEQALACIDFAPAPGATAGSGAPGSCSTLLETEHFVLRERRGGGAEAAPLANAEAPVVLMALAGRFELRFGTERFELAAGTTVLSPAGLAARVRGTEGSLALEAAPRP